MNQQEKILVEKTENRPLIIWGARMTGIGFIRFAKKYNLNPIGFVDSDKSLHGKKIGSLTIGSPSTIPALKEKYKDLTVVVAVSIKEDEILRTLKTMGIGDSDVVNYGGLCGTLFTIDISGSCNLKCPSCAHAMDDIDKPPKGFMAVDDFKKIIAKIKREVGIVGHISLYSWGEPFLHPHLEEIIKHAHSEGIATAVSTNFSISNTQRVNSIVEANPDYLKISTSGFYPDVYNSTHTGGNVNLVKSNLYRLKYLIERYNLSTFVDVNYHVYKNNFDKDLNKMQELCDELSFTLSPCYANLTPIERLVDLMEGRADAETKKIADLLLVSVDEGLKATEEYRNLPCRFLTNQVNIHWDRSVPICCVTFDRNTSTIAKDFLEVPLEQITRNKENHPSCEKCTKYGFHSYLLGVNQKGWDEVAEKTKRKVREQTLNLPSPSREIQS
ncbi:MAG: radical SAM protein [Bacteriovoracia bacterium]